MADDPNILDDEKLWRRVALVHVIVDKNRGEWRASSAAFTDHKTNETPMSVGIESIAVANGRTVNDFLDGWPQHSVACFCAGDARAVGMAVYPKPIPNQPEHGEVAGKKTKGVRRRLSEASDLIVNRKG